MMGKIIYGALARGLLLLSCGESTVRIAPPLILTHEQAEEGLDILEEALKEASARRI